MQVRQHYDNHLANFYSWMVGDLASKINEFKDLLINNKIHPVGSKVALDLGSGHGLHSIALKELGFDVTAVDFNEHLLNELKSNPKAQEIKTIQADIRNVLASTELQPVLIACCGDTITHLDSKQEIGKLIADSSVILPNNGILIITFRDYSNELNDQQRFVPVKSSADRILTCILEYRKEKVKVTDLLHEKIHGEWIQKVSSYEKVRICSDEVVALIISSGMEIKMNEPINRMQTIIAVKRSKDDKPAMLVG